MKGKEWKDVLAAYNAGIGTYQSYNGIPPITETLGYVQSITSKKLMK